MSLLGRIPQRVDVHFHFHFEPLKVIVTPIKLELVSGMDIEEEVEVAAGIKDLDAEASK